MKINDSLNLIKALADSSRLLIVNSLMEKPQYLEELSKRLNLAASTISFHLKKLESAGLIYRTKEQYYVVFHINEEIFNSILKDIISVDNIDKAIQDERLTDYYMHVIEVYFENGQLLRIPSQSRKRIIILNEILRRFDASKVYWEKEVDDIIKNIYPDYCSIRRYFIDYGMMQRKKGKYNIHPDYTLPDSPSKQEIEKKSRRDIPKINLTRHSKSINMMENEKRKEIIKNYKQLTVPMGIYQVKNLVNGKILIGSTKNLKARKNRELMEFETNIHPVKELQEVWNNLGEKGISFEVIDILEPKKDDSAYNYTKDLQFLEELWLEKLQPYDDKGYNEKKVKKSLS